jgi:hypothetical protein
MRLRRRERPSKTTYEVFGVPIELALGDGALKAYLPDILPPGATPSPSSVSARTFGLRPSGPDTYEVTVAEKTPLKEATLDVALALLNSQIRLFVAIETTDWIFVHAGVVALDGRALILPGASFSGKTTLVGALVEAGASYYSDEYAVFDLEGCVHPYSRRLAMRTEGGTEHLDVSELGGAVAEEKAKPALVAVTRYRPGGEWQPRRLSVGQGVTALLSNAVAAELRPQESLQALTLGMRGAAVLEGDRGEAGEAAAALLEKLAAADGGKLAK